MEKPARRNLVRALSFFQNGRRRFLVDMLRSPGARHSERRPAGIRAQMGRNELLTGG